MEREQRVFGNEKWNSQSCIRQRCGFGTRHHRGHGATLQRRRNKVVTIQPLAAHCKEQITRRHGTRVNGVARDGERAGIRNTGWRFENRAGSDGSFCESQPHETPPYPKSRSAASATSESSKGIVRSARICSFSWPL